MLTKNTWSKNTPEDTNREVGVWGISQSSLAETWYQKQPLTEASWQLYGTNQSTEVHAETKLQWEIKGEVTYSKPVKHQVAQFWNLF